jgi:hypothetical protein
VGADRLDDAAQNGGMFIGHFAVAFAAKRAAPRTSLGTLFASAQLLDLAWPLLVLAGVERVRVDPGNTAFTPLDFESYPWSHSALTAAIWAAIFGAVYFRRTGYRAGALVCALLVASHWVLDFVSHRPDLPLFPGGSKVGLGLWNTVPGTLVVEVGLFAAGVWLYLATTRPRDRIGRWALAALVAFLGVTYAANVLSPPPPSGGAVAASGLAMWLLVAWAAWADRHREVWLGGATSPGAARESKVPPPTPTPSPRGSPRTRRREAGSPPRR